MNYIIIGLLAILVGVVSSYLIVIHADLQNIIKMLEGDDQVITGSDEPVDPMPMTHDDYIELLKKANNDYQ